jgi:very-short-patch-repair endonuclease
MDSKPAKARTARARDLRANSTDAEQKLWSALGGRRLGGFKFRRQVPIDRYFADFDVLENIDGVGVDILAALELARP